MEVNALDKEMILVISKKENRPMSIERVCDMVNLKPKQIHELIESGEKFNGYWFDYLLK